MSIRVRLLKHVIKHIFYKGNTCRYGKCPYICNVFFIVLDLRLTKVGVQRYSFFYACTVIYRLFLLQNDKALSGLRHPHILLKARPHQNEWNLFSYLRSCFEFLQKVFLGLMYPFSCVLWAVFWSFSLLFCQIARYLPHHRSENASKTHPKSSHDKFKTASKIIECPQTAHVMIEPCFNSCRSNDKRQSIQ